MSQISRILQKFLKYFSGATISTSFLLPSAGVLIIILPVILALNLSGLESVKLSFGSSFSYCHKLTDVFA